MVTITISGPRGSGKTVLADFIAKQVGSHTGVPCEVQRGGNPRGPDYDTVRVDLTQDQLRDLATK